MLFLRILFTWRFMGLSKCSYYYTVLGFISSYTYSYLMSNPGY